jgi:hypothetical protein
MADNVAPTYAHASVKSGVVNEKYAEQVLGGTPPKKNVEAVEKENLPKDAPGSVRK